jgi:predicted nuclease of restriction endonuclease-like (RecB) superfamily
MVRTRALHRRANIGLRTQAEPRTARLGDGVTEENRIKDPYVLEFLKLPEATRLHETQLEGALISQLQSFLLELGNGFAFVGRQVRLTLDGDHFYPDLVFYHVKLKCYVVIDLKIGKLDHADLATFRRKNENADVMRTPLRSRPIGGRDAITGPSAQTKEPPPVTRGRQCAGSRAAAVR